jgi:hypothetical protein
MKINMGKTVSTIPATRVYEDEPVVYTSKAPDNPFKTVYVAHIAPHGPYGWTTAGHYDTQEEAEDAIKQHGYGGEVEQTTYYELYQLRA